MADATATDFTSLWNWRRRVAELYARIRAEPDGHAAWQLWRQERDRLFRDHAQSPLDAPQRAAFTALPVAPYNPALRLTASLQPKAAAEPLEVPAGADGTVRLHPFARTAGLAGALGGELTCYWVGGYGGGVFLPFADATSGAGSFGAGRYLLDTIKGADLGSDAAGRLILDFNFAYNPSCAYSGRFVCPLTPPGNRLPASIEAGEQAPG